MLEVVMTTFICRKLFAWTQNTGDEDLLLLMVGPQYTGFLADNLLDCVSVHSLPRALIDEALALVGHLSVKPVVT